MSGIQGLSSDQQQVYNQLINDAGTVNVSRASVDKELEAAMAAGLSFQEAAAKVRDDLPTLAPPKNPSGSLGGWVGVASPMASVNALITELCAEQREENREVMKAQTDSIVTSMKQQAGEIREKAVVQLICGVVSDTVSIGMGALQFAMGMKQLSATRGQAKGQQELTENKLNQETRSLEKQQHKQQKELKKITRDIEKHGADRADEKLRMEQKLQQTTEKLESNRAQLDDIRASTANPSAAERRASGTSQAYGTLGQSLSQLGQGMGGLVGHVGDYLGAQYDAAMKEMEADQERRRTSRDSLKSINDGLTEVIQKSLSTQDDIQKRMNDTRSRIMG